MTTEQIIQAGGVGLFTLACAVYDLKAKRLPNWLTVAGLAAGLLFHAAAGAARGGLPGAGWDLLISLAGFAAGFGIMLLLWLIGTGGGGDVKFMGALGAWMGVQLVFYVFLIGAVLTVLASIAVLAYEGLRLGLGKAQRRYVTAPAGKGKGAVVTEAMRQQALARRRLMPWAVPAGIAAWLVLAWVYLR